MRCENPCIGACGFNAECRVQAHQPQCICKPLKLYSIHLLLLEHN
jgi:hypothetical protein